MRTIELVICDKSDGTFYIYEENRPEKATIATHKNDIREFTGASAACDCYLAPLIGRCDSGCGKTLSLLEIKVDGKTIWGKPPQERLSVGDWFERWENSQSACEDIVEGRVQRFDSVGDMLSSLKSR